MKLLLDENIHLKIIVASQEANFSLVSVQQSFSEKFIKRIFSFLSIIYLKFIPAEIFTIIPIIIEFLKQNTEENLKGKFVVLTVKKKRVTDLPK